MSRIGKKPVSIKGVKVVNNNGTLMFEGPKGKLSVKVPQDISVEIKDDQLIAINNFPELRQARALHGLVRSLAQNCVDGVLKGYEKRLEITGVGYRAKVEGKKLVLSLGFSHPINYPLPEGISAKVEEKDTVIILSGIDKQLIGNVAADIRRYRPPEPYKGKGVKYAGEVIRRKKGKRVA